MTVPRAICYFCPPGRGGRRRQVGKEGPRNLSSGNEKEGDGPKREHDAIHQPDGRKGEDYLPSDRTQDRADTRSRGQPNGGEAGQPDACPCRVTTAASGRPGGATPSAARRPSTAS